MSQQVRTILSHIQKTGIIVVRSTRVSNGVVTRNGAIDDEHHGFVVADTLSPQKARILLMLALTKTSSPAEIQQIFWSH